MRLITDSGNNWMGTCFFPGTIKTRGILATDPAFKVKEPRDEVPFCYYVISLSSDFHL